MLRRSDRLPLRSSGRIHGDPANRLLVAYRRAFLLAREDQSTKRCGGMHFVVRCDSHSVDYVERYTYMTSLDESGFLSPLIASWIEKHRGSHSNWFAFADDVNQIGQKLMLALAPPKSDWQRVSASLVFSRVVSHFQAIILLAERGMLPEARSLLRGMLEGAFTVVAMVKSRDVANEWMNDEIVQHKKRVSSFRHLPLHLRDAHGIDVRTIDTKLSDLESQIATLGVRKLTTEYLAQRAEMLDYYNTIYVILCSSSHSRVADFESHVEIDDRQNFVGMKWGPDVSGIDDILYPACELLLKCSDEIASLFELGSHSFDIQLAWARYREVQASLE